MPEFSTEDRCRCAECGATFVLPAVARCPSCSSRQVRRVDEPAYEPREVAMALMTWFRDRERSEDAVALFFRHDSVGMDHLVRTAVAAYGPQSRAWWSSMGMLAEAIPALRR